MRAAAAAKVAALTAYQEAIDARLRLITAVDAMMDNYASWVLSRRVADMLCSEVNAIMALMQGGALMRLDATWSDGGKAGSSAGHYDWFLSTQALGVGRGKAVVRTPYIAASGFQRAAMGIAMRIAFTLLGGARVVCRSLVLDEAFVACDADNLAHVPAFLRALLARYDGILLVSHIEDVKDAADAVIPIDRIRTSVDDAVLSRVRFGQRPRWTKPKPGKGRMPADALISE